MSNNAIKKIPTSRKKKKIGRKICGANDGMERPTPMYILCKTENNFLREWLKSPSNATNGQ